MVVSADSSGWKESVRVPPARGAAAGGFAAGACGSPGAAAVAGVVEPRARPRRELLQGGRPARHGEGIRVEGAAVVDPPLAPARIVVVHHLRAAAEGAHREATPDDLAQRGEIGPDAEACLRAARRHPK